MQYWLVKTDPETYSWDDLVKDKSTDWDGVRNYQARNNLKLMKKNDLVLIYHSQSDKEIKGYAKVIQEYYQDPTTDDERWVAVKIAPVKTFKKSVSLEQIKSAPQLQKIALLKPVSYTHLTLPTIYSV